MKNVLANGSKFSEALQNVWMTNGRNWGWDRGGGGGGLGREAVDNQIQEGDEQWWIQTLEVIWGAGS